MKTLSKALEELESVHQDMVEAHQAYKQKYGDNERAKITNHRLNRINDMIMWNREMEAEFSAHIKKLKSLLGDDLTVEKTLLKAQAEKLQDAVQCMRDWVERFNTKNPYADNAEKDTVPDTRGQGRD